MPSTPLAGLPYPSGAAAPAAAADIMALALAIDAGGLLTAVDEADRDARYATAPAGTPVISVAAKAIWVKADAATATWLTVWSGVRCRLERRNPQTLARLTATDVAWDTSVVDDGGFWSGGTLVNIPHDGTYTITASAQWQGEDVVKALTIYSADKGPLIAGATPPTTNLNNKFNNSGASIRTFLTAGDTLHVECYHDGAGNLDLQAGDGSNPGTFIEVSG